MKVAVPIAFRHVAERCAESMVLPLRTLVQHVCVKTPDRAEYRGRLAKTVVQMMDLFSDEPYSLMLEWIERFSRNSKVCQSLAMLPFLNQVPLHVLYVTIVTVGKGSE